jgi:hypothetical protein
MFYVSNTGLLDQREIIVNTAFLNDNLNAKLRFQRSWFHSNIDQWSEA